ncbi:recombinase family protein [Streptomyces sp. NBC_00853]|uniref:recombinase family protein n=1 Tax=Streptomyces sp. NBC_00853 TaxID=2903681 RepID=UPI003872DEE2|nr:recombinase family protein [Streptomyces sp. NBC_00853]
MTTPARNPLAGTAYTQTLRGVRCVRLSVLTDETTSPERQREAGDVAAASLGIDFSEGTTPREAVDLDVSASKFSPFDRPELGQWLQRPDEFDALVWWRFDRAIRSMGDMHDLAKWARQHRKMLVFAEGIGGGRLVFDFRNPMDPTSELMMMMLAFAAQVEAQSIKDRVTGAIAAIRKMSLRWAGGGRPPYGYMPVAMPAEHGGVGWTLAPDPDAVSIIERIIRELLDGLTIAAIALRLNADDIPTPRDHWSIKKGRSTGGRVGGRHTAVRKKFRWAGSVITRLLTNPNLLGWKMHEGKPVRDARGNPVMCSETPILTREEFDMIGTLLKKRGKEQPYAERVDTNALLLAVVHCAGCEERMYLDIRATHRSGRPRYVCNARSRGISCAAPAYIRADWVEEYVRDEFLRLVGSIQTTRVTETPGYDPQPELLETLAEFTEHQEQQGRQKSNHARQAWQERADALDARIADLETREKVEPQRVVTPTGQTFADEWTKDAAGRRRMLVEAGVRLDVGPGTRGGWRRLDTRRVAFSMSGELDPAVEAWTAARDQESEARNEAPPARGARMKIAEAVAA